MDFTQEFDIFFVWSIIGKDKLLSVDANQIWEINTQTVSWLEELMQYDIYFIEEPTSPDDILGYRELYSKIHNSYFWIFELWKCNYNIKIGKSPQFSPWIIFSTGPFLVMRVQNKCSSIVLPFVDVWPNMLFEVCQCMFCIKMAHFHHQMSIIVIICKYGHFEQCECRVNILV